MFEILRREFGCVGQIGVKSGALDGPALIGMPTCVIDLEKAGTERTTRMSRWGRDIPHYDVFYPESPINVTPDPPKGVHGFTVPKSRVGPRIKAKTESQNEEVPLEKIVGGMYKRILAVLQSFAELARTPLKPDPMTEVAPEDDSRLELAPIEPTTELLGGLETGLTTGPMIDPLLTPLGTETGVEHVESGGDAPTISPPTSNTTNITENKPDESQ